MILETIVRNAPLFLLIFARTYTLLAIAPMTSSAGVPIIARIGLAFFSSFVVFPQVAAAGYPVAADTLSFMLLMVGEILLGALTALMLVIVFSIFQMAGQLFSLQMGFGASQVFDPLAQVEMPIVGQFLNLMAMMVFLTTGGFQRIFLSGLSGTFGAINAWTIASMRADWFTVVSGSLARLFAFSAMLSMPILGTLFLLSVTMGLLSKAAPQMNLLMLGFPVAILVAFTVILLTIPFLIGSFDRVIDAAFNEIGRMLAVGGTQ